MINITFLGTSSMIPTEERNHSSIFMSYKNEGILIDCGEGTQRQLRIAKIKPSKITKLLITHWHGDHVLGIPGLIQNLGAHNYSRTLDIYGPKNSKKYIKNMFAGIELKNVIKFNVHEISKGVFLKNQDFVLECIPLNHNIPCLGYCFRESDKRKINLNYLKKFGLKQDPLLGKLQKGKSITYKGNKISASKGTILVKGIKITVIMDTAPTKNIEKLARNSDLLITEATWGKELEYFVEDRKHLTAEIAAKIAKKSKVNKLILTHFSQRYKSEKELEEDAKDVFDDVKAAKDFMEVQV